MCMGRWNASCCIVFYKAKNLCGTSICLAIIRWKRYHGIIVPMFSVLVLSSVINGACIGIIMQSTIPSSKSCDSVLGSVSMTNVNCFNAKINNLLIPKDTPFFFLSAHVTRSFFSGYTSCVCTAK